MAKTKNRSLDRFVYRQRNRPDDNVHTPDPRRRSRSRTRTHETSITLYSRGSALGFSTFFLPPLGILLSRARRVPKGARTQHMHY